MEMGSSVEEVREDACGILEEMSQNLQLGFIRLMAYTLTKVLKRLFTSVYVNMEGLNMVGTDLTQILYTVASASGLLLMQGFISLFNVSFFAAPTSGSGESCDSDAQSQELCGLLSYLLHPVHI